MVQPFNIGKVAVLGAGVMGAQIAAHLINAGVPVLLFDLSATDSDNLNEIVLKEIQALIRLNPPAFTLVDNVDYLQACNYAQDLQRLAECSLIIEAVSENLNIKLSVYEQIAPYIPSKSLMVTNTSGLSIEQLAQALPLDCRRRFFGTHFFNPPRYMTLVELIPGMESDRQLMEQLENFLVSTLGKGIVYAHDSPNFVANRIGIFSMLITLHYAQKFNLGLDVVDALTGPLIGRPKSATLRTADVVGLDTFEHAVATMTNSLPNDPWHRYFKLPQWMDDLIKEGALGQKTRKGVYKKEGNDIYVYDIINKQYRLATNETDPEVKKLFASNFSQTLTALRNSSHPEAQFLCACFREVLHYAAYHLESITYTTRDADFAMRWGFGWLQGPFELWQSAGWKMIADWIKTDVGSGKSAVNVSLPAWVESVTGAYSSQGAFAPQTKTYLPRRPLPVYERQLYPELMPEETPLASYTLFENNEVRLWHTGDEIAILSFKTKLGSLDNQVLDGIYASLELAQGLGGGLILWNNALNFSVGANLKGILSAAQKNQITDIERLLENFQRCTSALFYAPIPTVAAVRGFVLGGGCEILLHCQRSVVALESIIGLVEASVGLVPAGGGCAMMVRRAWETLPEDPYPLLEKYCLQIIEGLRTTNAHYARKAGYLRTVDKITFNPYELLFLSKEQVRAYQILNYRASLPIPNIKVFANDYQQRLLQAWENSHRDPSIHDIAIARQISFIFGHPITENEKNVETELLRRERESFINLVQTTQTQDRIDYMLNNGKPLKN